MIKRMNEYLFIHPFCIKIVYMKNLIYYILIYILLTFLTGILNFSLHEGYYFFYLLFIIMLSGGSYILDLFRVKRIKCNSNLLYIRRSFLYLKSRFFYKSLFLKIISTFLGVFFLDFLFSMENSNTILITFFCIFIIMYVNVFPMFFVIIDTQLITLFLEKEGGKNIHIVRCDEIQTSCYLGYNDLKKIMRFNSNIGI